MTGSGIQRNYHPTYRPDIDGLRAIAVLSVVVFHTFPNLLPGGFVGVDVFFVISGYLISSIILKSLARGNFSFIEFYSHRIKRIFPALILVLSTCVVLGWYVLLPVEYKQLGKHIAGSAGFIQNLILWQEAGYFDIVSDYKPLVHLWSLALEEQFYLIYPFIIWLVWRTGFSVPTVIVLFALLSFSSNISLAADRAVSTFFSPATRFWELLAGGVLAHQLLFNKLLTYSTPASKQVRILFNGLAMVGLFLVVAAVIKLDKSINFPGGWATIPVVGTCLLILAGSTTWVNRTILTNRVLVFIGLISYPLYLWHWPLLSFAKIVEDGTLSNGVRAVIVIVSVAFAWLTYWLVEWPIRFGVNNWKKTGLLCLLAAIVGVLGYKIFDKDGLEYRHTKLLLNLDQLGPWKSPDRDCRDAYPQFKDISICNLQRRLPPSILLVGDSHSGTLYPGLAEALSGTQENILNLAEGGCVPFFGVASHPRGNPDPCLVGTNERLSLAENLQSIRTIILASRGPMYITGRGFGRGKNELGYDWELSFPDSESPLQKPDVFEEAMRNTLMRLSTTGKQIIFVVDVPELGFNASECIALRPYRLSERTVRSPCVISRKDFDERNRMYRTIVTQVASEFPMVKIFDAAAQLCDSQYCYAMSNGRLLYRDDDHLSIAGSKLIAEKLAAVIKPSPPPVEAIIR